VRIPQREEKIPQAAVTVVAVAFIPVLSVPFARLPLHRREAAENVPVCVRDQIQSVRAPVAAAVKFLGAETVAAVSSQQIEALRPELCKQQRIF
jgi:hypothetical protein